MRCALQHFVQRGAYGGKFLGTHDSLHALEELALLFADVLDEFFPESSKALPVETTGGRASEIIAEKNVFGEKFCDQRLQLEESGSLGKQFLLLCREVDYNFALKLLLDFHLPRLYVDSSRLHCTIKANAQRQRVLVLPRKRDQVRVTQHAAIIHDADCWLPLGLMEYRLLMGRAVVDARVYIGSLVRGSLLTPAGDHSLPSYRRVSQSVRTRSHS